MSTRRSISILLALCAPLVVTSGCTHSYTVQLSGTAAAGSELRVSYWAQGADGKAPTQREGRVAVAAPDGSYTVTSTTVLDFAGPPPHVVLQVTERDEPPLCVVVPTRDLWVEMSRRQVTLPPIRPIEPGETSYELPVPGLSDTLRVVAMDTAAGTCVAPGG